MSKEIDAFVETLVKEGKGTREQIIQQFANSDDTDLVTYATNQNKPKREEAEQSYVKMFTEKHPTLGVSPADVLLYGGLTGAALAAGKKVVGGLSDFVTDKFKGGDAPTQPAPSTSTQDMMAKPTPVPDVPVTQTSPTSVPSPVPSPEGQTAPVDPVVQAKLAQMEKDQARKDAADARAAEAHAAKLQRDAELHELRKQQITSKGTSTKAEPTPKSEIDIAAAQATQKQVEQGKIKLGKEGGSLSTQGGEMMAQSAENTIDKSLQAAGTKPPTTTKQPVVASPEAVAVAEGRIPNYMQFKKKKSGSLEYKNKQGSDVIGKGGWNWYQGQMGPEAEKNWLQTFGRTNQSTTDVQQAIKEGRLKGPEVVEGRGGSFKREATVPEYIRGSAPVEAMARSGLAALGILPVAQKIKEGDYKGALNEAIPAMAMIAPALSLAASPLYSSEGEQDTLKTMKQKGFKSFKEFEDYKKQVGSGRGIAPPSDYLR